MMVLWVGKYFKKYRTESGGGGGGSGGGGLDGKIHEEKPDGRW
jgi:hypothetical protein